MNIQANRPISPLSVMAQHRRYEEYTQGVRDKAHNEGIDISKQTVQRIVQESTEAVLRNLGTVMAQL